MTLAFDSSFVSDSLKAHHKQFHEEIFSNSGEFIYEISILVRLFAFTLSGVNLQPGALTYSFQKFHSMTKHSNKGKWPSCHGVGLGNECPRRAH